MFMWVVVALMLVLMMMVTPSLMHVLMMMVTPSLMHVSLREQLLIGGCVVCPPALIALSLVMATCRKKRK